MHNNIVQHLRRYNGKQAIEIEVTLVATAAPTSVLRPDCDLSIGNANNRRIVSHLLSDEFSCLLSELLNFLGRILRHILRRSLSQVLLDPIRFALCKTSGFLDTHPLGASDHDLTIRFDLDRNGFAVALYNLIRHIHTLISSTKNGWPFSPPNVIILSQAIRRCQSRFVLQEKILPFALI